MVFGARAIRRGELLGDEAWQKEMRRIGAVTTVLLTVVVGAWGCSQRVEPGEDQADAAPPARLGPEIDTATGLDVVARTGADISGEFDVVVRARAPMGGEVRVPFLALVEQEGEIASGDATVRMELRRPDAPEEAGATTEEPAEVDEEGAFEAVVDGFTVQAGAFDRLAADTSATVRLVSQIVDGDCFRGDATITMTDVEIEDVPRPIDEVTLEGPFRATRESGACSGGGASDAGDGTGDGPADGTTDVSDTKD